MIPTKAVQEFYDELDEILKSQPSEWQAIAADQKVLWVSTSDFDYYVKIGQQFVEQSKTTEIELDKDGLPILFFAGIRVKPLPVCYPNQPMS